MKELLINCFNDTLDISNSILSTETINAINSNKVYKEKFISNNREDKYSAEIEVRENTSFNAAKQYSQFGKVAVLNFANPHFPGGGVKNGAMAQEECLCRSSNLYLCLNAKNVYEDYYLYNRNIKNRFFSDRLIYTKNVTVFKDDSDVSLLMPQSEWFNVDVITCAAPYIANRKYTNKTALKELFKSRIKNIFESAIDNDVDVLVLGAFGCGAFKNPPDVVAKAFHEVIEENEYSKKFERIVFAIKRTVGSGNLFVCPNVSAFEREFLSFSFESEKNPHFNVVHARERIYSVDEKILVGDIVQLKLTNEIIRVTDKDFDGFEYAGEELNVENKGVKTLFSHDDIEKIIEKVAPVNREKYYSLHQVKNKKGFNEWKENNKYFGKQFSILGDSISTLKGYNPRGYKVFYAGENCGKSGVSEMQHTWWGKVIDFFGGELLVNNSWSGSRVTKLPNSNELFPSGCSDERTNGLHINNVKPNVIIVYLGTNDWAFGARRDDETRLFCFDDMEYFEYAYSEMLRKLKQNYPNAEIWCCTLNSTYMSANSKFVFPEIYNGNDIKKYNDIIRDCTRKNNCNLIDLYANQLPYDSIDGTHPNANGMGTLAVQIIRAMADDAGASFLDCKDNEHDYIVIDEFTGNPQYVCRKCGKEKIENAYINPDCDTCLIEDEQMNKHFCSKCGAAIDEKDRFCSKCGNCLEDDKSPYIWNSAYMNTANISEFTVSFGDCPIVHISFDGEKLTIYNRINGSRDGYIAFPDDFFDNKLVDLTDNQRSTIKEYLKSIDFSAWKTEDLICENYENGADGFCINNSFTCKFNNGESFKCYGPEYEAFWKFVDFLREFCDNSWFEPYQEKPDYADNTILLTDKYDLDYKYAPTDPDKTVILYDNTIRLFIASRREDLEFKQDVVSVGKEAECDVRFDSNYISRQHARFYFENSTWFIADTGSMNGVWLNGNKLEPKTKYELAADDEIDIAHKEILVFYKTKSEESNVTKEQEIKNLERAICDFYKTEDKETRKYLFAIIASLLLKCPMYVPVTADTEAMLKAINIENLEIGKELKLQNDVRMEILTIEVNGEELVPIFTTKDEVDKGPDTSILNMYPCDYLPKIAAMDKNIIINAFGDDNFVISKTLLNSIILPMLNETGSNNDSENSTDFEVREGVVIDGKYELLKLIGQSAFSKIYLAIDKRLDKAWAVKICDKKGALKSTIDAMVNEANMVKHLDHPAIPTIVDIIDTDRYLCIVEDYIEGATLENILKEYGAQPQENVIEWAKQLCDVLGYLHSQNPPHIYRDVKPANIILKPDGKIVLVDFGIMRTYKPNNLADTVALGTKGYAAPEQYGNRQTDARTDIYGLGMTLHHLLTGVDPKTNNGQTLPICQINPNLSKGLEYIINKCIELDPDKRFQSMQELKTALDNSTNCVYASPNVSESKLKKGFKALFGKKKSTKQSKKDLEQKSKSSIVKCENGHL